MPLSTHNIHVEKRLRWSVAGGFGAVVMVTLISGFLLLRAIEIVGAAAQRLSGHQLIQMELIDKLQREQAATGELLYAMVQDPNRKQTEQHRQESARLRTEIQGLVQEARQHGLQSDEVSGWIAIEASATLLFDSIDASLAGVVAAQAQIGPHHRRFVATMARLLDTSFRDATTLRAEEMRRVAGHFADSAKLLGGAVILAIAGAIGSVVFTFRLLGRLETQATTLRTFAVHVLNEQELSARRFSQELHDEFGQTLNAIEATLSVVKADGPESQARLNDAKSMVKESIANAREMARLLRPSILDDFGLDEGLRELAKGFSQRTGIVVDYTSTLRERLVPEVETHLYRIAQEALTNISRHSSARRVSMELKTVTSTLIFRIQDDGQGMSKLPPGQRGLGLIGMAERANAAGGKIRMTNVPGQGVEIVVEAPVKGPAA